METFDAAAAREAFRNGKVAMLIDRAERAATWSDGHPLGVAPLPGSERVYEPLRQDWETPSTPNAPSYLPHGGGWLVGVRRGLSGPRREAAIDLARYLASPENVNRLRARAVVPHAAGPVLPDGTGHFPTRPPPPTSIRGNGPTPSAGPCWPSAWCRACAFPDAAGYLDDLSKARVAALAGKDPEAALREVAAAWTDRTRARGTQRQLWHYRRSLNSLATLPQPPPRGK